MAAEAQDDAVDDNSAPLGQDRRGELQADGSTHTQTERVRAGGHLDAWSGEPGPPQWLTFPMQPQID